MASRDRMNRLLHRTGRGTISPGQRAEAEQVLADLAAAIEAAPPDFRTPEGLTVAEAIDRVVADHQARHPRQGVHR